MSCPVMHHKTEGGSSSSSPPQVSPRQYVQVLAEKMQSVGCDSTLALYNYCQQKVAKAGAGDCADQARSVLACEGQRRLAVKEILNGQTLLGAYDECCKKSAEHECVIEAQGVLSKLSRSMLP